MVALQPSAPHDVQVVSVWVDTDRVVFALRYGVSGEKVIDQWSAASPRPHPAHEYLTIRSMTLLSQTERRFDTRRYYAADTGRVRWTLQIPLQTTSNMQCFSPRADSGVVRIEPLRFLTGCRKRRLSQALSVLSLSLGFFWCMCCAVITRDSL